MEVHSGHTYRGGLRDLYISHETTKDTDNAMSLQVVFELICNFLFQSTIVLILE